MLFTNVSMHATLLTRCLTSLQLILTISLTTKAGYNGGIGSKLISKQTLMEATNSGATTKR